MQELAMLREFYNYTNRPGTNPGAIKSNQPGPLQPILPQNQLLSLILKRKGGEQKITLKIFVKFSFSLLFHFTYFPIPLVLTTKYTLQTSPNKGRDITL
jgi:hypothetical protein